VEAAVLRPHVGRRFPGVVVAVDEKEPTRGDVVVQEPAIESSATSRNGDPLPLGTHVQAVLTEADPTTRTVRFEV
jgi:hypothetical protein